MMRRTSFMQRLRGLTSPHTQVDSSRLSSRYQIGNPVVNHTVASLFWLGTRLNHPQFGSKPQSTILISIPRAVFVWTH